MVLISNNNKPPLEEFERIIQKTVETLNDEARTDNKAEYFKARSGVKLEEDIYHVMLEHAKGTPFEDTIEIVSSQKFPDIIAGKYYGVEVKSTKSNSWTSTGSSIIESTRVKDVERIYLMFGKLSDPVEFMAKPYEECLSDIVVTHSPRYKIDMKLDKGDTIFEKMNVNYDDFRKSSSSIRQVKKYYTSKLKPGQELWWIESEDIEEQAAPPIIRMWNTLDENEKNELIAKGLAWFPEVFSNSTTKYYRFALWLVSQNGVVTTSLRDPFSAGGKIDIITARKRWKNQSRIFYNLWIHSENVKKEILHADKEWLAETWQLGNGSVQPNRIEQYIDKVTDYVGKNHEETKKMLKDIFNI